MKRKQHRDFERFARYLLRTYRLKLSIIALLMVGVLATAISSDGTFLVFAVIFFGPILFMDNKMLNSYKNGL